jgi:hypothetical protein
MAIPILRMWRSYFQETPHEGLGSSYERVVLNLKLGELCQRYHISTCLEVPVFGFTGLTGINSLGLARQGVHVTLVDDDEERLDMIRDCWSQAGQGFVGLCRQGFFPLPFEEKSFDFSWNFSALWFVADLQSFLGELTRVTKKAILICVPNTKGLGYLSQKYVSGAELRRFVKERHIVPRHITTCMASLRWNLVNAGFIDVPPWPDIGMTKEEFLQRLGLAFLVRNRQDKNSPALTIMNYYTGADPDFVAKMLRYYWFERKLPVLIKAIWAHHRYLLFARDGMSEQKDVFQTKTHCVANERAH